MDKLVVQWILQHAMKHSYRRVMKEVYVACPEIKCTNSMQEFSYSACRKFCSEKRDFDLNRRKMLWYCVRGFILSVPRIPVYTLRMCSQIIIILKWMIAVETVISKQSWPFSADVLATLSSHNQKFEKMWTTLAVEPIPWKEDYHELKLKLIGNNSDVTTDYMKLFKNIMDYLISCLEKCLEEMRSCLPSTAIEEVQCSKILHSFDDATDLPANPWDRFNCVQAILRKDSSEDSLLSLLKMLTASTSEEMNKVNERSNSLYSSPNSSKFNLASTKAMVFMRGKSDCRSSLPSPQSSCQRKRDSCASINQKKASAFEGGNLYEGDKKSMPSKDLNLSIEGRKRFSLKGGKIYDVQDNVVTLEPPIKIGSPAGVRMREKRVRRVGDVLGNESLAKKFAGGGVSNDGSISCVGSVRTNVAAEDGSSCKSTSPLIYGDEEELRIVQECDRVGRGDTNELEEMCRKEPNVGQASSPTVIYPVDNLACEDKVGKTQGKNVSPVNEEVDGCLVRVVPENEINFPFSIDYPSQTAGTSGHDSGGNVNENEDEETLIKTVSPKNDMEGERLCRVVEENEINYSCSIDYSSQNERTSDLVTGRNVNENEDEETLIKRVSPTNDMEGERLCRVVEENEINYSCSIEYSSQNERTSDLVTGRNVNENEDEETLIKRVSPTNDMEGERLSRVVEENEINYSCSIDYSSQNESTSDLVTDGNVIANGIEKTLVSEVIEKGDEYLVSVLPESEINYPEETQRKGGTAVSTTLGDCENSSISKDSIYVFKVDGHTSDPSFKNSVIVTDHLDEGRNFRENGPTAEQASEEYEFSLD
ncbi:uncharacterized protein LOC124163860 [Ischnura elegans]|uniref:uncharacterized protein LOC124163860 n=1 Tax=Ischnura elegans TaxID=197161 RepID=UPI001ED8669E|nr:uncharacterized protein LOC124163860 [Ischnura elegans]